MKLSELVLNESIDLDFAKVRSTYGSWIHPSTGKVVYVSSKESHKTVVQNILGFTPERWRQIPVRDADEYTQMFIRGWVRVVHNDLIWMTFDGFKESLAVLFKQILPIRYVTKHITVDIEELTPERGSVIAQAEHFIMPHDWNDLLKFLR